MVQDYIQTFTWHKLREEMTREERVLADIRQLSSDTLATLLADVPGCERVSRRYDFIDRVRHDFGRLVDLWQRWPLSRQYESWQDAWRAYKSFVLRTTDGFGGPACRLGYQPSEPC